MICAPCYPIGILIHVLVTIVCLCIPTELFTGYVILCVSLVSSLALHSWHMVQYTAFRGGNLWKEPRGLGPYIGDIFHIKAFCVRMMKFTHYDEC